MSVTVDINGANSFIFPAGVSSASTASGETTINLSTLTLKTNGTTNGSQATLNLANGSNVAITDGGSGTVTIAATQGPLPSTSGMPVTTPAAGTPAFDSAANKLWVYNGAAWKGVVLT